MRWLPSATKYGSSPRNVWPAAAWRVAASICCRQRRGRRPPRAFPERFADELFAGEAAGDSTERRFASSSVPFTSMMPANNAPCSKNAWNLAFAAAASASSWRSRCSASRWRVTSRTIFDAPTTPPSSSVIGEIVSETRMRRPSEPQPLGLEVFDPLSGLQARDDLIFLGNPLRRDDQRDVAADRLPAE